MATLGNSPPLRKTYLQLICAVLPLLMLLSYQQQVDNNLSAQLNRTLQAYNLSVTAASRYQTFLAGLANANSAGLAMLDEPTLSALNDAETQTKSLTTLNGVNAARNFANTSQQVANAIERIKIAAQSVSPAEVLSSEQPALATVKNSLDGVAGSYLKTSSDFLNEQQNRQSTQRYVLALATIFTLLLVVMIARRGMRQSIVIHQSTDAGSSVGNSAFTQHGSSQIGEEFAQLKHDLHELNRELASALSAGAQQVTQGNKELSELVGKQSDELSAMLQQIQALSRANERNAVSSKKANELARGAALMAGQGGQMVEETTHTLQSLREDVEQAINIISFLDSFTSQSHLLVLNAAMEAARAGEVGTGFVATSSELGNLAQRSSAAIKQLREVLDQVIKKIGASSESLKATGSARRDLANAVSRVIVATATPDTGPESRDSASVNQRELRASNAASSNKEPNDASEAAAAMAKIKLYRHRRLNVLWQAKLWVGDTLVGEGVVKNLSATGAFVETSVSLESGIRYFLAIHNAAVDDSAGESEVVLESEIMRVSGSIGMSRSYGLHFLRIRRQDKVVLRQQVASLFIQQSHADATDHDLQDSLEAVDRLSVISDDELSALKPQQGNEAAASNMRAASFPH